jgi:phosphoglycolate phosphatase-like HAD superfamily hydrolase
MNVTKLTVASFTKIKHMVSAALINPLHHQQTLASKTSGLTIFCDFDGPIMDVSERYYNTYRMSLEWVRSLYAGRGVSLPLAPLTKAQFWHMKQCHDPDRDIALRSGLDESLVDLFMQQVRRLVNQPELLVQDRLQPGVRCAFNHLRSQGARLVLVTLRCRDQVNQILEQHQLTEFFHGIWGAEDCFIAYDNQIQHKVELLRNAWASELQQGYHPEQAWMIGDTEADVVAGQQVGIGSIALTCGIRNQCYLEQFQPTYIQPTLFEAIYSLTAKVS